jgi:DNA invertase Pin-like site-specific DNA recombinase
MRSAKIQDGHRQRLAIVYVRQSSPQQVLEHRESRARQYALADHAATLGWPPDRVRVIDEDQGQSGRSADQRAGFQCLLAEVAMEHVGLVLGLEMSRLARSSKDWHNLLELCAVFGTLLADQDGVYNPNDSNDRLLLGLKGTMSEFELFTMRNRLQRGLLNKAERGELFLDVPIGYVKLPTGEVALDPDEQVRAGVQLFFDKFAQLGSLHAVYRYLLRNRIRLGIRVRRGPHHGELEWRCPSPATLHHMLHHPFYAGAYAFGRRKYHRKKQATARKKSHRWLPMEEWPVLKRDHLPAYITWDRYLANLQKLQQNQTRLGWSGAPRQGCALLSGLLVCGTCGHAMAACYTRPDRPVYQCKKPVPEQGTGICYGVKAAVIDDLVAQQILRALQPAALELSLQAARDWQKERDDLHRHWRQQLQRTRYQVERAERQYHAVEPENRLVAHALEGHWEKALRQWQQTREDYDRFTHGQPAELGETQRQAIRELAADIPGLWHATDTSHAERKEVVRSLIAKVVVHVRNGSQYVDTTIHWQGGFTSQHEILRPVRRYVQLADYHELVNRVRQWHQQGQSAAGIADKLNQEGFSPPHRRRPFTRELVQRIFFHSGIVKVVPWSKRLGPDEWRLSDLAQKLRMPAAKLRRWLKWGRLRGRLIPCLQQWIVSANSDELKRLQALQTGSRPSSRQKPASIEIPAVQ